MNNLLDKKNIVSIILQKLSKYGNIPSDGFLCGGAVANMLMSLKWGDNHYPINDLDIFIETKKSSVTSTPTPLRTDKLTLDNSYDHLNISYNHGNSYRIISSLRDGMINIVKVFRENRDKSKNYMYILKGFDLNCTQVGIDLKTGELIYTDEFKTFLDDKQLKVVAPYTPAHTAIRIFKKIDELGCYCDVDSQMKLLSQPLNNPNMIRYGRSYTGVFALFFSIKYKEIYDSYSDKIKPYFKMVSLYEFKKVMWEKRWEIKDNSSLKQVKTQHVLNWLDPDRNPPQQSLDNWAKMNGKVWGVLPVKYNTPDENFIDVVDQVFSPLTLMGVWGMLYGGLKKSLIKKVKITLKYDNLKELSMVINQFYNCDFSDTTANELDNYIGNNREFASVIYKYYLNIQESIELKNTIIKLLNKEGKWFSSMIFNLLISNGHPLVKPDMNLIMGLFEKEKVKLTKPIIKGIDLSDMKLPSDVDVKELVSEYDLAYAGKKLSNCINNPNQKYKEKIKKGDTKIFVITTPGSMSALEITKQVTLDGSSIWKERWTLSYCNKECNDYHRKISMYISSYVQKELLLEGISASINRLENRMDTSLKIMDNKQDTSTKDNPVSHDEVNLINLGSEIFPTTGNLEIADNTRIRTEIISIDDLDNNYTTITTTDNGLYPF